MTETPQPKWTWEQIAAGRTPVGERFAERRSLWFTPTPDDASATSHNAALASFGEPLYDLIPQMCDDLNAAEEQRHATESHFPQCRLDADHEGDCYDVLGNRLYFFGQSAHESRAKFHATEPVIGHSGKNHGSTGPREHCPLCATEPLEHPEWLDIMPGATEPGSASEMTRLVSEVYQWAREWNPAALYEQSAEKESWMLRAERALSGGATVLESLDAMVTRAGSASEPQMCETHGYGCGNGEATCRPWRERR